MLLQRLMKIAVEAKMCPNCFLNFRTRFNLLLSRVEFMSNYAQGFFFDDRTAFYIAKGVKVVPRLGQYRSYIGPLPCFTS